MKKNQDAIAVFLKKNNKGNLTYDNIIETIDKVSNIHKHKTFGYMTQDDIYAQSTLICIKQLKFYKTEKGRAADELNSLERWLNHIVKNRLKNFYRDNCCSSDKETKKARIRLSASAISNDADKDNLEKLVQVKCDIHTNCEFTELSLFIDNNIPENLKEIYKSCLKADPVSTYYKNKLKSHVDSLIKEWNEK